MPTNKRRKAPRHPPQPEAKIKKALAKAFTPTVNKLSSAIANGDTQKVQEVGQDLKSKLNKDSFDDLVRVSVVETAESAREQLIKILHLDPDDFDPDMEAEVDQMIDHLHAVSIDAMADLTDKVDELLDGDEDVTEASADSFFSGVMGSLLAGAGLAFAAGFARFNRAGQVDAGVERYTWSALHDNRVRSEHEALDGVEADWDNPPLGSDESSSEEECHPGDDYNCRCVAVPIEGSEADEDET